MNRFIIGLRSKLIDCHVDHPSLNIEGHSFKVVRLIIMEIL